MPLMISTPSVLCKWRHSRTIPNIFFRIIFISNLSRSLLFTPSSSPHLANINFPHLNYLRNHTSHFYLTNFSCYSTLKLNCLLHALVKKYVLLKSFFGIFFKKRAYQNIYLTYVHGRSVLASPIIGMEFKS